MIEPGTVMFLTQFTPAHERLLYPGTVTEVDGETFVVRFADAVTPSTHSDVSLYAQIDGKFVRQPAAIIALRDAGGAGQAGPIVAFRPTAEAVSVDQRLHARVTVTALGMHARIGRTPKCQILDLCPEGFAAISAHEYQLGDTLDVAMTYPGLTCSGRARVQTRAPLPDGTWRYGFMSVDAKSNMRRMLGHITNSVRKLDYETLSRTG